jgi:biotin transporter BioY
MRKTLQQMWREFKSSWKFSFGFTLSFLVVSYLLSLITGFSSEKSYVVVMYGLIGLIALYSIGFYLYIWAVHWKKNKYD